MSPATRLTKLKVYNDALWRLAEKVLPLMERRLPIYKLTPGASSKGSRMMGELLSREVAAQRAGRMEATPPLDRS